MDMVKNGGVLVGIEATEKEPAIDETLTAFCNRGKYSKIQRTKLKNAIMEREGTGSTGIGNGGAIPHCRIGKQDEVQLYISVAKNDIEFQSIDGKPVKILFLIVLPKENSSLHSEALKAIASLMKNERFFRYLKEATSEEIILETIEDYEAEIA